MKKFTIITLSITFILSLTLSAHADWVGEFNDGINPINENAPWDAYDLFVSHFNKQLKAQLEPEVFANLNSSSALQLYGVDPYASWTAKNATIIGAYDVANFGHNLTVYNDGEQVGYANTFGYGDVRKPANFDPISVGTGDNISFKLGSYFDNKKVGDTFEEAGAPNMWFASDGTSHLGAAEGRLHMLAFDVTDLYNALWYTEYSDVYMFAWEDREDGSTNDDWDYNDLIVFMTNIEPNTGSTPEPATMAILGLGLAGLGLAARRRRK